jgi:hypothetical protein
MLLCFQRKGQETDQHGDSELEVRINMASFTSRRRRRGRVRAKNFEEVFMNLIPCFRAEVSSSLPEKAPKPLSPNAVPLALSVHVEAIRKEMISYLCDKHLDSEEGQCS